MAPLSLTQALVRYDRQQSTKRHYNPHALNLYLERAEEVETAVARGADMRAEIIAAFSDRLRAFVLKHMGLAPLGAGEESGALTYTPSR